MARPVLVGTPVAVPSDTTGTTLTGSSIVVPTPSGAAAGERILFLLGRQSTTASEFTPPAGVTRIGLAHPGSQTDVRQNGWWITSVLTDPVPADWTFLTGGGLSSERLACIAVRIQNYEAVHDTPNTDAAGTVLGFGGRPSSTSQRFPPVEAITDCLWLGGVVMQTTSAQNHVPIDEPSTSTQVGIAVSGVVGGSKTTNVIWQMNVDADVAQVDATIWGTAQAAGCSNVMVLRGADPPPAAVFARSQAPLVNRASVTVDDLHAHIAFGGYVPSAHRGGSAVWPEMTQHAYQQAVSNGFCVLELSMARTSDGVWFGLHDASLDRTSQEVGLPNASAMTWAEVQAYQVEIGGASAPQPYVSFADLMADPLLAGCAWFVDPKVALGFKVEFLDMLDANGGPERFIVKYYGVGSGATGLADDATARGYTTWGYFYHDDVVAGDLTAEQDHWTWLGMDGTNSDDWTAALSHSKPVFTNSMSGLSNLEAVLAYGAAGTQWTNPTETMPAPLVTLTPVAVMLGDQVVESVRLGEQILWENA